MVAHGDGRDPGADGAHPTGDLGARRERQRRLELVHVLDDQDIGEVDGAGLDVDDDLTVVGRRVVDLLQHEGLGGPEGLAQHGSHRRTVASTITP